jgi:transcription initiation factor TFIID subunit 2
MGSSSEAYDCHRHPELKRKVYSALQESDEGELSIVIPKEVALRQTIGSSGLIYNDGQFQQVFLFFFSIDRVLGATPEPTTPGSTQPQALPEFSPIIVNIAYSLRSPVDGVEFILPNDIYPYVSHLRR